MVVVNKCGFGKSESQGDSSPKCFTSCDSRGMLLLNQEAVINKGDINSLYRMDKGAPFATGLYAQVKRCKSLITSSYYAAKFCPRKRPGQSIDEECIENLHEIALLSQLKHPYIISFIDAFILEDCAVTIMELAPGGDLQTVIDADLVLLEKDASRYIFQLLEALKYLHERNIAHLDIKPQNLLLMGEFPTCEIKLCDFEISRVIKPGKEVKEIIGTPEYVAPEILLYEPLSTSADMWSVGILCYVLLTGFSPFGGDTDQETFRNIVHEPIDFPEELFEDISPSAIDFILKLAVKNAKLRPTPVEMEEHEWLTSFIPEVLPPTPPCEPELEPEVAQHFSSINHSGPKKRSPRKTMALAGMSTASAAGRRPSARSILRACKSAYDLNKMGGKTKSREALIEKMKIASGDNSVGGNWKLRKNLSKSREQLWESKIQLSKSCEKINNNLPGSARWASVANFPSLDLGMKSATSQESVISVVSTCTSAAATTAQYELDWNQQCMMDDFVVPNNPLPPSISMPNTPPIPNFDLSAPVNHMNMAGSLDSAGSALLPASDYPSLVTNTEDVDDDIQNGASSLTAVELESQKSVAELIMTFGGRVPNVNSANGKKLDLKNQFEPILEVDGSEETTISLGDCSDNNSTSGVSSIIPTTKEPKSAESGHFSMNSSSSNEQESSSSRSKSDCDVVNKRVSRSSQQIRDEMRAARVSARHGAISDTQGPTPQSGRRGSGSPPKLRGVENGSGPRLKGILKKSATPTTQPSNNNTSNSNMDYSSLPNFSSQHHNLNYHHQLNANLILPAPPSAPSSRRGSIPGNCTRHTISSLAKVPKKSILKNSQNNDTKSNPKSPTLDITNPSAFNRKSSGERSNSKSPENIIVGTTKTTCSSSPSTDLDRTTKSDTANGSPDSANNGGASTPDSNGGGVSTNTSARAAAVGNKGKVIPKGLSPRERPSFILLHDVNPKVRKPTQPSPLRKTTPQQPIRQRTSTTATNNRTTTASARAKITNNPPTPRAPPKPRTSIREQILQKRIPNKSGVAVDRVPSVTLHIAPNKILHMPSEVTATKSSTNTLSSSSLSSSDEINCNKMPTKSSKVKSEPINFEPAAVAIKIFPPDPAIIPKSVLTKGSLSQSQSLEENSDSNNNNGGNKSPSCNKNNNPLNFLTINNNSVNLESKSPEARRKGKTESSMVNTTDKAADKFDKSTWGGVCTGSIGRAMERFETGAIKGKKLRRGSVPDF